MIRRWAIRGALALPLVFVAYFFVYPLATILVTGLTGNRGSTLAQTLGDGTTWDVAWFTLWQAVASTLLTIVIGLPAAWAIGTFEFPGRRMVRAFVTVPFVLPTVVVGAAFLAGFGRSGALGIDLRGTIWVILLAHVFYNISVVIRTVGTALEQADPALGAAAATLGASPRDVWRHVTLPLMAPAIASAASIVFLFSFTSFGVILILGDIATSTLEVEVWRRATGLGDLGGAAGLALLQLVGVVGILWWYSRYQQRRAVGQSLSITRRRRPGTRSERLGVLLAISTVLATVGVPIGLLVAGSFQSESGLGLGAYGRLFDDPTGGLLVPPGEAIANSLLFAIPATVLAVALGLLAAATVSRRGGRLGAGLDTLLMLPLGTSAVTLGFGMLLALDTPVDLRTSLWLVPVAHALIGLPFVVRTSLPMLRSIQPRLREAAAVLGATPAKVWREIDLPLIKRGAIVGGGFAFAVSLGEFGATNFLALPDRPTIPVAIFRLLGQPGTFESALALATILMVLTGLALAIAERQRMGGAEI